MKMPNNWGNSDPAAEHFHWSDPEKVSIQDIKVVRDH